MRIRTALVSACLAGLAFTTAAPAMAAPQTTTSASAASSTASTGEFSRASISSWLTDNGVSKSDAARLMKSWDAGKKWDSATASKAVSSRTYTENGYQVTRTVFPDASIAIASTELPATSSSSGGISVQSIGSCTGTSTGPNSGAYQNCKSTIKSGNATVRFTFNYTAPRGGYSYFDWAGDQVISGICNVTNERTSIDIKKQTEVQAARASHKWSTTCGGAFSTSGYQTVMLKNGYLSEDWSF